MSVELLRTKDLAARLSVSTATVSRWNRVGLRKGMKMGRVVFYDWDEVLRALHLGTRLPHLPDFSQTPLSTEY